MKLSYIKLFQVGVAYFNCWELFQFLASFFIGNIIVQIVSSKGIWGVFENHDLILLKVLYHNGSLL